MKYKIKEYEDIKEMVNNMTVEELLKAVTCPDISPERPSMYHNLTSVFFHNEELMKKGMEEIKNDKIKPLVVADMEQKFVPMRACANSKDKNLLYQVGKYIGLSEHKKGYNWGFGPCVDITGDTDSPVVNNRSLGRTPKEALEYGVEVIKGMQDYGIVATAKHFPGDGYCKYDQHLTTAYNPLSFSEWKKTYGKCYEAYIECGLKAIMPGHIALPSYDDIDEKTGLYRPATFSKKLLTNLLKEELGFDGIIVSDAVNMGGFCGYMNIYRGFAESLEAGCDVLLFAHPDELFFKEMKKLIDENVLTVETLRERAYRVCCFARENTVDFNYIDEEINESEMKNVEETLALKSAEIERDRYKELPFDISKKSNVLINIIYSGKFQNEFIDNLISETKKRVDNVTVIRDAGPDKELKTVLEGNFDLILCFIAPETSYGLNTARVSGPVARNMMGGWQRMGTPCVFITNRFGVFYEYEAGIDILINTNGSKHKLTAKNILDKIIK